MAAVSRQPPPALAETPRGRGVMSPSGRGSSSRDYTLSDFETTRELGTGSFGVVRQVVHRETGETFAMKVLEKQRVVERGLEEQLKREVLTQLKANHPNVVRMLYYFEDSARVNCLLEYADKGQLFAYLRNHVSGLPEPRAAQFFSDSAQGLAYLHGLGVAHRDLKPENILLYGESLRAKLGDLGWCVEITAERPDRGTFCGTPDYLSPEMWLNEPHDTAVDLWALGVLLFEMLVARAPFAARSQKDAMELILAARPEFPPGAMSQGPQELISGLLQREQKGRTPLAKVLQHPWVATMAYTVPGGGKNGLEDTCVVRRGADGGLLDDTRVVQRTAAKGKGKGTSYTAGVDVDETKHVVRSRPPPTPASSQQTGTAPPTDLHWESRDEISPVKGYRPGADAAEGSPATLDNLNETVVFPRRAGAQPPRASSRRAGAGPMLDAELLTVVDDTSIPLADFEAVSVGFGGFHGPSRGASSSSTARPAPAQEDRWQAQAPLEEQPQRRQWQQEEQQHRRWGPEHRSDQPQQRGGQSRREGGVGQQASGRRQEDVQVGAAQVCFPGPRIGKARRDDDAVDGGQQSRSASGVAAALIPPSEDDSLGLQSAGGLVLDFFSGLFGMGGERERERPTTSTRRPQHQRSGQSGATRSSGEGSFTVFG
mmetsp:Transcript_69416/g.195936  ORF Transcript_69416/g.195936 Transcript_69416/m.195936 type:complete len:656 (-) Transcript_69416:29-1996(-)